jgi:hypothetical protein
MAYVIVIALFVDKVVHLLRRNKLVTCTVAEPDFNARFGGSKLIQLLDEAFQGQPSWRTAGGAAKAGPFIYSVLIEM